MEVNRDREFMRRAFLVATVLAGCFAACALAQKSVEDIVKQSQGARTNYMEAMAQGIVRIEAYPDEARKDPELGTGIVLTASPEKIWILTALHVVQHARSVDVTFYSSRPRRYRASVLPRRSDSLDLSLIEVVSQNNPKLPTTFPVYQFLQNGELQLGEQIYSVNGDWNLVPNTISRLSHEGDVQRLEYTNVSVGVGFSGGPVFDQYGNVIAMHDALSADGGSYAIAIKIDSALQTLQALDYAVPKAVPFSMPRLTPVAVAQSTPTASSTAASSVTSDLQLFTNAMLSRDPAAMEAAAGKISSPTYTALLRSQAQVIRETSKTTASAQTQVAESSKRLEMENMKIQAKAYSRRGNYMKALPLYRQLAEGGDSESMVNLGYLYYNGLGIEKDYRESANWFEKAAAAGETSVMSHLGLMYAMGEGVPRNDSTAVEWDRKAAATGDALGMLGLGFMYENGRSVPKDLAKAVDWYRKSANLGNETAKENLRRLGVAP